MLIKFLINKCCRWSLIAKRLPGRTDNEIKNYWNSHLNKKMKVGEKQSGYSRREEKQGMAMKKEEEEILADTEITREENSNEGIVDVDGVFDFYDEGPLNLKWVSKFLELN